MCVGRSAMLLGLALAGGAVSAPAQDLPTPQTVMLDLSPYVRPGKKILISGDALRKVGGTVVNLAPDTIFMTTAGSSDARPYSLNRVDTLWTRGNWFWPGLALGTSAGVFVGGAICVFGSKEKCLALPVATLAGVTLGVVVGKARGMWVRRYARRDGGPVPMIRPSERR